MAPKFPDEVNVFIVPHSRMKDLVGSYMDQLSTTDFKSNGALESLLPLLEKTFHEFKTHELIENKYIMERLKQRLKMVNVTSQSVCNCHEDSQVVRILDLLKDGYTCANKPVMERMSFGSQLQEMVSEFTRHFIPHMEEEEEIFQPLLMKYFAYEELRMLKEQVIREHEAWKEKLLAQKVTAENMLALLSTVAAEVGQLKVQQQQQQPEVQTKRIEEPERLATFNDLPEEMVVQIFSYLNPQERSRCARVSKHWNVLVHSPQLWRSVYPTNWARGLYDFQYRDPYALVETEWTRQSMLDDNDDGDEDPSGEAERQIRCYEQFTMNALVRFGDGVQRLIVAGGLHLSSAVLRSMLILCPNLQYLDASYTNVTDLSFKGLAANDACIRLEHLDLTGCRFITDVGLERLGACFKSPSSGSFYNTKCRGSRCKSCPSSKENPAEAENDKNKGQQVMSPGLSYLSLSGCKSVTDFGLASLLEVTLTVSDSLTFMDVSGCPMISGGVLNAVAGRSPRLQPQDLYYCNRIVEGPYSDEANGCQNLECPVRNCCLNMSN